ncbi:MAG: ATP-binding protein, partial [Brevinematia bacterium]
YVEFRSDIHRLREYAMFIVKDAPEHYKEANLLEQQISELIKNAIRHGNKNDVNKKVKVWYSFEKRVKIIVLDEGEGFKDIDDWNKFNLARTISIFKQDFENIMTFISWRSRNENEMDGGNALFGAIEYWNGGIYFNEKGNKVCAIKYFPDSPDYDKYK